jgi:hypothetical protein
LVPPTDARVAFAAVPRYIPVEHDEGPVIANFRDAGERADGAGLLDVVTANLDPVSAVERARRIASGLKPHAFRPREVRDGEDDRAVVTRPLEAGASERTAVVELDTIEAVFASAARDA